jgi:hypothetical protein
MVGLEATNTDKRVAALSQGFRDQILQLASLVAPIRNAGVAVFTLSIDRDFAS